MKQTFAIGDHARMLSTGLREAFGTTRGLLPLLDQCGIVQEVAHDAIVLDMGDYGLVKCSAKNAYQTMPAGGFEDMPDFLPWEDETTGSSLAPKEPSSIPTVKQELDRKVGDTLDWMMRRHKDGSISDEALSVASDGLFMAVSGLADDELMTVMTAIGSYLPSTKAAPQHRVFTKSGDMLVVRWRPGECQVHYIAGASTRKTEHDSPALAHSAFKNIHTKLAQRGYKEEK